MKNEILLEEGRYVLHLFFSFQRGILEKNLNQEANFKEWFKETQQREEMQILLIKMVCKCDFGMILMTKNFSQLNRAMSKFYRCFEDGALKKEYSYFSQTEKSEYKTSIETYAKETLLKERKIKKGTPEYLDAIQAFEKRMKEYEEKRISPNFPKFDIICFYPMSKKRSFLYNWYALPFSKRATLMREHAKIGRKYAGKVTQIITGSTGLDNYEWGVTLFSESTSEIKNIVHEMRFDKVSSRYGIFGDFYIGTRCSPEEIFS